jgi:transposase
MYCLMESLLSTVNTLKVSAIACANALRAEVPVLATWQHYGTTLASSADGNSHRPCVPSQNGLLLLWPLGRKETNSRLPSVIRTDAPMGQTPVLRDWWTRDYLSAISARSPEGKRYFRSQDHALNSEDVVAFVEHLLREVPGRIVLIWDGSPIHRSQTIQECLAHGAAHRLHLERLPAYAPELNPAEGIWQQLKGVEWRNVCGFDLRHLRDELRGFGRFKALGHIW